MILMDCAVRFQLADNKKINLLSYSTETDLTTAFTSVEFIVYFTLEVQILLTIVNNINVNDKNASVEE
jgi:hypothetical protein